MTASFAFAQATTGALNGTVKDSEGAVIPGASVSITGVDVGFNRTVVTNASGVYRVEQVPSGLYRVTVAPISGFGETTVESRVIIEKTTTTDITLNIAGQVNVVEVSTDPLGVVVDTTDSKLQTN